ncbi:5-methylcytosine-specific restriction enzyme A [Vibrio crassostreae]|nr:5-methylcytosine-specific restriction enzyme A [Vibrio crassostreae]CAK1866704.1 5-methylcytosine-specific restriction enzyme A [Vibrio crassostreae]CAK1996760.1 5-methylcytosine-specific restriction enzyme A [Vibrio crassostreae]CAK1997566.1 5-methylcytosine-specific restriction enzyme A [Vibrio crassostreae]CAK2000675.1 5-methylcytosine-specific restriction enzyme A [Vibrio crassostreae]
MYNLSLPQIGTKLNNTELCEVFGCSPQGGMRRSHKTNTLVIVSNHIKSIYDDRWVGDVLHYTGMGSKGDQSLTFQQNKTLAESRTNGVSVHLFEVFKDQEYTYVGEVALDGEPHSETQDDEQGNPRKAYLFPLQLVTGERQVKKEDRDSVESVRVRKARKLTVEELQALAAKGGKTATRYQQKSTSYERNIWVAELAKRLAKGQCQLCLKPAPFNNAKGDPYLETHHIVWLSKDGDDTPDNTVALCPNCHKKMHIVDDTNDVKTLKFRCKQLLKEHENE